MKGSNSTKEGLEGIEESIASEKAETSEGQLREENEHCVLKCTGSWVETCIPATPAPCCFETLLLFVSEIKIYC